MKKTLFSLAILVAITHVNPSSAQAEPYLGGLLMQGKNSLKGCTGQCAGVQLSEVRDSSLGFEIGGFYKFNLLDLGASAQLTDDPSLNLLFRKRFGEASFALGWGRMDQDTGSSARVAGIPVVASAYANVYSATASYRGAFVRYSTSEAEHTFTHPGLVGPTSLTVKNEQFSIGYAVSF